MNGYFKYALCLAFCLWQTVIIYSQVEFAPVGSEWIYGYDNLRTDKRNAQIITSVQDTLIEDRSYRLLTYTDYEMYSDGFFITLNENELLLREEGEKIYRYIGGDEFLFFDFSLEIGESYFSSYSPDEYVLDSISSLVLLGENTLTYHFSTCGLETPFVLSINNMIGPMTHLFSHQFFPCSVDEIKSASLGAFNWFGDNHIFNEDVYEYNLYYNGRTRTAFFETPFYFEDAIGNRDTVILGSDPDSRYPDDKTFGQINLESVQTTGFEVRLDDAVIQYSNDNNYANSFKKYVSLARSFQSVPDCFISSTPVFFLISGAQEPIKVSWEPNDWKNNRCTSGTSIIRTPGPITDFFWKEDPDEIYSFCLIGKNEHSFDFEINRQIDFYQQNPTAKDTVFWLELYFLLHGNACDPFVNTDDISNDKINIYPNPNSGTFHFSNENQQYRELSIYTIDGKLIKNYQLKNGLNTFENHQLDNDLYIIQLKKSNGKTTIQKMIITK